MAMAHLDFINKFGFVILSAVIIFGILYFFDLLDPARYMPESCNFGKQIECKEFIVSKEITSYTLQNNMGDNIYVLGATFENENRTLSCKNADFGEKLWERGTEKEFTFTGCNLQSNLKKQKFTGTINWRLVTVDIRQVSDGVIYSAVP